jgi:hypothetical protein
MIRRIGRRFSGHYMKTVGIGGEKESIKGWRIDTGGITCLKKLLLIAVLVLLVN